MNYEKLFIECHVSFKSLGDKERFIKSLTQIPEEEKCELCGGTGKSDIEKEIKYENFLIENFANKLLTAIENETANFGSDKLNKIVELAMRK